MRMTFFTSSVLSVLLLGGCGDIALPTLPSLKKEPPAPVAAPATPAGPQAPLDATGGALDVPDLVEEAPEQEIAPETVFTGSKQVVASLGDPAVPGLWMETSLVSNEQKALLRSASGAEVVVTLKPSPSAGSARVSIAAMRALGVPLTELVELQVRPAN
ncbi:hypothetical protein PXK00_10430 [Phaeobacter sp. QD34_3]|uniref:hypothetical protein n=1 Tax=unclassified Phaeobacter TaxID=2621772 RepID=UPI00237EECCB|nr:MULTISPECIES: hypothetical protein [unclassified Phaeobacter]MDE4133531.1 hypothetical protein [Phaeobacter sp. QD34_3]MDE4137167.1 hypothetical protein [Phaeobacter sp. QD34_24]